MKNMYDISKEATYILNSSIKIQYVEFSEEAYVQWETILKYLKVAKLFRIFLSRKH